MRKRIRIHPTPNKRSYIRTPYTNWSIKDFPAKYLCVTVEIYITDKSGKRHIGWIDIVQEGDDDNDGCQTILKHSLEQIPITPTQMAWLNRWDEIYIYETDLNTIQTVMK